MGKLGLLHLNYLREQKAQMYCELLFNGKLAEHCATIEKTAFQMAEQLRDDYSESILWNASKFLRRHR